MQKEPRDACPPRGATPTAARARRRSAWPASTAWYDRATHPRQLEALPTPREEGRYRMTSAEAILAGHQPPERRAPCFFDPRHGPSARDVEWAPPGGTSRKVPACEADAQ